jgi:D-lactate dehydrogenase
MKVLVYSAKDFEIPYLKAANSKGLEVIYSPDRLTTNTAMKALGFDAISIFSADDASTNVIEKLHDFGVSGVTLRSTGYDNVSLKAAKKFNIRVANSPGYSPNAIAEHAIALLLALNRNIVRANNQLRQQDFRLSRLVGFDLMGKKVGVLGTGAIGRVVVKIINGFGCEILANDIEPDKKLAERYNLTYVSKREIQEQCDIVIICLPLNSETHKLFDLDVLNGMKKNALIVNIARGAIVDTKAVLTSLDKGHLGGYASDVYEKEAGIYFYDRTGDQLKDPLLKELMDHRKVLLTPHQAFATKEALKNIAEATFYTLDCWRRQQQSKFELV